MKSNISNIMKGVVGAMSALMLLGCSAENPFDTDGQGIVKLRTVVNSITTRADGDEASNSQALSDNCIVYISGEKGLVYKKQGLNNVDTQITLKSGQYVAEAWTGDSVTASFDKKFYRGYQPFEVTSGSLSNVVLNCKIRNVVASVNTATINPNLMKDDYKIIIKNSGVDGELVFTKENAESAKGYFMMPKGDTALEYMIEGTRKDGKPFSKSGKIENVESAHHYILNFEYNPNGGSDTGAGAVFIKITIKDEDLGENDSVDIYAKPTVAGVDFDIDKQRNYIDAANIPDWTRVQVCAFGGLDEIVISTDAYALLGFSDRSFNVLKLDTQEETDFKNAGLTWLSSLNEKTNVVTAYVEFKKTMLEKLPTDSKTEYTISITAKDNAGKITTKSLRIVRNEEAIIVEDPVVIDNLATTNDLLAIGAHSVTLTYALADECTGTPGIEYRKAGSEEDWKFQGISTPSNARRQILRKAAAKASITITGLEPGTTYEYRAAEKRSDGDWHSTEQPMKFTTEETYTIPGASFEEWSTYTAETMLGTKTVTLPWSVGDKEASYWGSGNEGSATANITLTDKSTNMTHSGTYSACLESKSALGLIAAGNIFTGTYVRTDGTNGVLSVGRPYNGSHPTKLKVYANYRPGSGVKVGSGNDGYVPTGFKGGQDHGQIYVALTSEAVEIRTNPDDRKLFTKDDPVVLAYGQVTWTGNFGPDGALQELEIPLEYKEAARITKATHLVIVCSASKYGDYFSGAAGSKMYLDDFELVY